MENQQPPPEDAELPQPGQPPRVLNVTRRINDRLYVAGEGAKPADLMFIATSVQEEEARETQQSMYGSCIRQKARYLKGPSGCIIKDLLGGLGIDMDTCYYTALIKWLTEPKAARNKPKRADIEWAMPMLEHEIQTVKPKIIVCFGKPAFDAILPHEKFSFSDAAGAWFYSEKYQARVYLMHPIYLPVYKPEYVEKFRVDFLEVRRMLQQVRGVEVSRVPLNYRVCSTRADLCALVAEWAMAGATLQSVDCEWAGKNHIDGRLRSIQFSWKEGVAVYVKFMDQDMNYVMDCTYQDAGEVLGAWLNQPHVKYVGHHYTADAPWMSHWLGLEVFGKCYMDTEFGQQTIDEYEDLGLDRLAMKYTDLGRYDFDLIRWKKANKEKTGDEFGYGLIPDDILVPYACKDVDAVFRAVPFIEKRLKADKLEEYFYDIFMPFVTDVFLTFAMVGLPMNKRRMDDLRDLFSYAKQEMSREFQNTVFCESRVLLMRALMEQCDTNKAVEVIGKIFACTSADAALNEVKQTLGPGALAKLNPFIGHYFDAPMFNIRSNPQMRRWLFDIKGYVPIKSTNNKEKDLPSTSWDRVLALPKEAQAQYTPSTDKQSIQILSETYSDEVLHSLLRLNAVGNLSKAFLKEADVDEDTGELIKENGLHFWVCSDGRVHGQMSTTETGRPRSWKPNSLNWPSYVNKNINDGISALLKAREASGELPERFKHFLQDKVPSIRSCVDAEHLEPLPGSAGWCLVESDYQTAELRGLAFLSGDENFIRLITEPDPQFGIPIDNPSGEDVVRLAYDPNCGILPANQNPDFVMAVVEKGKVVRRVTEADLVRKADGSFKHPKNDLHWSLAEIVQGRPREVLDKKKDRNGTGKVGNFSTNYGASEATLERKIEADTGKKPEPGTGGKIMMALAKRQPVATSFLKGLESVPEAPGYWRAESGRLRRFITHGEFVRGLNSRAVKGMMASLARELKNFPMQESVASTAARAGKWLLRHFRDNNFHARTMIILYDSCVTICPVEERFEVAKAHQRFMTDENQWHNHGRTWSYPIDTEFNYAWGERPSKEKQALLNDPTWNANPSWIKNSI